MFTTIKDPASGRSWHIYGGEDLCETYEVGATIPPGVRTADPRYPGDQHLADDVYHGSGGPGDQDAWIIIKDGVILPPVTMVVMGETVSYLQLYASYGLEPPPESLWTESQWAAKARRSYAARHAKKLEDAVTEFMTPKERMGRATSVYLSTHMGRKSMLRRILSPETTE